MDMTPARILATAPFARSLCCGLLLAGMLWCDATFGHNTVSHGRGSRDHAAPSYNHSIPLSLAASPPDDHPIRQGKLTLSDERYSGLYSAVIDPEHGHAYFATANSINPGWVIKLDITGAMPVEVGAAHAATGEFNLIGSAIDPSAGFAYFGTTGSPGQIVKVALGAGSAPPRYVGAATLASGENSAWGMVMDTRDPDPARHVLYVATGTSPGRIVKVMAGARDALPERIAALTLEPGENTPRRAIADLAHGFAYFATMGGSPKVIKIGLTPGQDPPSRAGAVPLDANALHNIGSAVIDVPAGYAYFGTYDVAADRLPAKVYKVALGDGAAPPRKVGEVALGPADRELSTAVIDPEHGYAYFGSDHTYPAKVFQIALGPGSAPPVLAGVLQLEGGTQPNPPDGRNVSNRPETAYGEVFLQSSVIDPTRGAAYFGTDSHRGQVVKVALAGGGGTAVPTQVPRQTSTATSPGTATPAATLAPTLVATPIWGRLNMPWVVRFH